LSRQRASLFLELQNHPTTRCLTGWDRLGRLYGAVPTSIPSWTLSAATWTVYPSLSMGRLVEAREILRKYLRQSLPVDPAMRAVVDPGYTAVFQPESMATVPVVHRTPLMRMHGAAELSENGSSVISWLPVSVASSTDPQFGVAENLPQWTTDCIPWDSSPSVFAHIFWMRRAAQAARLAVRQHVLRALRRIKKLLVCSVLRALERPNRLHDFIVSQRSFHLLHGAHPPRLSGLVSRQTKPPEMRPA
jgi:hypothetical protein